MGFKEFVKSFRERAERNRQELDGRDDSVTTDKYLRSLRRMRRVQQEEREKELLKRAISNHNMENTRRFMFGFGNSPIVGKSKNILRSKKSKPSWMGNYNM